MSEPSTNSPAAEQEKVEQQEGTEQRAANVLNRTFNTAPSMDSSVGDGQPLTSIEHPWHDDYKATVKAVEFDGTLESAEAIAVHYGPEVRVHVAKHLPVMPDVVTLRIEQASGLLICYGGQWLAKLGKKYAVINGDDAYGLLEQ